MDAISNGIKSGLAKVALEVDERGIFPNLGFVQAIDIYDPWKSGNPVPDTHLPNAVECGQDFDVFFIIERQSGIVYAPINSMIHNLVSYFPLDDSNENTKGARFGAMAFGLSNQPEILLAPISDKSKSVILQEAQSLAKNPANIPANNNQNLYIGSAVNDWHEKF